MSAVETENQALAGKALGLQRLKAVPHDHGHFGPQGRKHLHTGLEHAESTAGERPSEVKWNLLLPGVPHVCLPVLEPTF